MKYRNHKIKFANGGDRNNNTTPEILFCEKNNIELLWSIGGNNKLNSSIKNLNLSAEENLIEASYNFYNYLNILDITECSGIAVAPIPDHGLGKTILRVVLQSSSRLFKIFSKE